MELARLIGLIVVAALIILIITVTVYDLFNKTKVVRGFCKWWSEDIMGTWSILGKVVGYTISKTVCELFWF